MNPGDSPLSLFRHPRLVDEPLLDVGYWYTIVEWATVPSAAAPHRVRNALVDAGVMILRPPQLEETTATAIVYLPKPRRTSDVADAILDSLKLVGWPASRIRFDMVPPNVVALELAAIVLFRTVGRFAPALTGRKSARRQVR